MSRHYLLKSPKMAKRHPMATLPQLASKPRSSVFFVVITGAVIFLGMRISLPFEAEDQSVGSISYQELLIHIRLEDRGITTALHMPDTICVNAHDLFHLDTQYTKPSYDRCEYA